MHHLIISIITGDTFLIVYIWGDVRHSDVFPFMSVDAVPLPLPASVPAGRKPHYCVSSPPQVTKCPAAAPSNRHVSQLHFFH